MNPYPLLITLSLSLIGDNQINHKITNISFLLFCVNHKIKIIVHCQKHQLCFNLHHSYYRTSCRELAYKVSTQLDHVRLQSKCLIKIGWISKLLFGEVVKFSDRSILFIIIIITHKQYTICFS
jgi:hypothetical protein